MWVRELGQLYDRRDLAEARRDLAAWITKWSDKYSKLTDWVEENIDETLTFYRLPRQHHKHLKSTDEIDKPFRRDLLSWGGTGDRAAKSRARGCKPDRAAFSVAPRLRHLCAAR